jgi:hypothetical protein
MSREDDWKRWSPVGPIFWGAILLTLGYWGVETIIRWFS